MIYIVYSKDLEVHAKPAEEMPMDTILDIVLVVNADNNVQALRKYRAAMYREEVFRLK